MASRHAVMRRSTHAVACSLCILPQQRYLVLLDYTYDVATAALDPNVLAL
jgi:hypothetical protein